MRGRPRTAAGPRWNTIWPCAREVVEHLKREVDDDPAASNRRIHKAQRAGGAGAGRAGRGRARRRSGEVEAQRARREKTHRKQTEKQKEPRASTTDPEVRPIKMADGGFRPAGNVQVVTAAGEQIVVGVPAFRRWLGPRPAAADAGENSASGSAGCRPRHLADGGFVAARRHRMGSRRRRRGLLSTDPIQAWQ